MKQVNLLILGEDQ